MEEIISKATKNNWEKLNKTSNGKLTTRANKRLSKKRIIPIEYINNKSNYNKIMNLLELINKESWKIEDIIYSLAINIINTNKIKNKENVKEYLKEYSQFSKIDKLIEYDISKIKNEDLLGIIYQSLISEGKKIKKDHTIPQKK